MKTRLMMYNYYILSTASVSDPSCLRSGKEELGLCSLKYYLISITISLDISLNHWFPIFFPSVTRKFCPLAGKAVLSEWKVSILRVFLTTFHSPLKVWSCRQPILTSDARNLS